MNVFTEGLENTNETMATIADMHVMAMAPKVIRHRYFADLFPANVSLIINKKAEQESNEQELWKE